MGVSVLMTSGCKTFTVVIVVSPLTTEAILGLDFLHAHQSLIDLPNKKLHLTNNHEVPLSLCTKCCSVTESNNYAPTTRICESSSFPDHHNYPSRSEMSIMATPDRSLDHNDSVVLLEEAEGKQVPVIVACGIAKPGADRINIVIMNTGSDAATIYDGIEIATAEPVDCVTAPVNNQWTV